MSLILMKIATLNIDWAKKQKSRNHFLKIENELNQFDFNFLILTEAINLDLKKFNFKYFTEQVPENVEFETVNYSNYLHGEKAFRTIIYSKNPAKKQFQVRDPKTSLALEFETEFGDFVIYATIIGTLFRQKPFAKNELENCIADCEEIFKSNQNLIIIGDLNTSFLENEKSNSINSETTQSLKKLFSKLNLINATEKIENNIDHVIIPKTFKNYFIDSKVFVKKGILSDHKGICIELNRYINS